MATVTDSRRRKERGSGSTKVAASKPQARTTSMGSKQQMPAVKPKTVTQGGTSVNSNTPAMRQIQAKAEAARARAAGKPGIKGPITLPNSAAQARNLVREGAQRLRTQAAGTLSSAQQQLLKAKGAANVASAQARRGAKAAMKGMEGTLSRAKALRNAGSVAKAGVLAGVAYEVLKPRPVADGTLTAQQSGRAPSRFGNARDLAMKKASAIKGSPVVGPKKSSAQQFDSAFASARKAGKSVFTWRGKKYNTKLKGE